MNDDPHAVADKEIEAEIDAECDPESAAEPGTGNDDQIDDPIRIYPDADGRDTAFEPRRKRLAAAQQIKRTRRRFRHIMLATDFRAPFGDRDAQGDPRRPHAVRPRMEVSVVNIREKRRLTKVLGPNLGTLDHIVTENRQDFALAIHRGRPMKRAARHGGG